MTNKAQFQHIGDSIDTKEGVEFDVFLLDVISTLTSMLGTKTAGGSVNGGEEIEEIEDSIDTISTCMNGYIGTLAPAFNTSKLSGEVLSMQNSFEKLKGEKERLESEISEKKTDIDRLKAEIDELNVKYEGKLSEYRNLLHESTELLQLEKSYSEKKLNDVKSSTEKCRTGVQELIETFNNTVNTSVAESFSTSLNNFISCFQLIKDYLPNKDEIDKTICEAREYEKKIEYFVEAQKKYQSWFNVVKNPLDRFEEDMKSKDYKNLASTITASDLLSEYKQKEEEIEKYLSDLDRVVTDLKNSALSDYESIIIKTKR